MSPGTRSGAWRKRWRRVQLRLEGGLDGQLADRLLPWAFALIGFVVLTALDAAAIRSGEAGAGLGAWRQAAWRRANGGAGSPLGGVDPTAAWSWIGEPILWVAGVVPAVVVFSVVQAAAIAAGVVPLWRLARGAARLRVGASSVVVATYLLAPALHRTNLSAFHPEVIALPAILWAYLEAWRGRWVPYGVAVAIVLACHGGLGITVAALGVLVILGGHRRPGAITIGVGLAWSAVAALVAEVASPSGRLTPSEQFVARTVGPLAVVPDLVTDPFGQLRLLVSEPSVQFLVVVLAPVLFLPLVAPRRFAAAAGWLVLAIVAEAAIADRSLRGVLDLSPSAAHIAPALAFVYIALVFALERIGTLSVTRVNVDRRLLLALLAGSVLLFIAESPASPYERPWAWGSRDAVDGAREEAVALLDPDEPVAVSPPATALVAERAWVHELPLDPRNLTDATLARATGDVDHVVLDTTGVDPVTDLARWPVDERARVLAALADDGFEVAYEAQGIFLLERTAATAARPDPSGGG